MGADSAADAATQLATFIGEMERGEPSRGPDLRELTMDEGIEQFLTGYLDEEKGRAAQDDQPITANSTPAGSLR